ncbi:MAG: TetR/AcrR family transcriptional regulator [Mesorhizobium sp.]|nr:TetR/AcrR family transcriptional regulator [Mesorhizobium sp.]
MAGSPRESDKQRRYHHGDLRRTLLDAAERELEDKGIEGFTLRGCAKRAGVSHAAPAHHFKDANALLSALAAEGFARFTRAMDDRQAAAAPEPRERMIAAGLAYLDFALASPAMLRLMFSSERPDHQMPELEKEAGKAFDLLVRSVKAMRGDERAGDQGLEEEVAAIWATVHGMTELVVSGRMKFLPELFGPERDVVAARIIAQVLPRSENHV